MRFPIARPKSLVAHARADRFAVGCRCGNVLNGVREGRHQILPCPRCGEEHFVLGRSALPTIRVDESPSAGPEVLPPPSMRHRPRPKDSSWSRWSANLSAKVRAAISRWLSLPVLVMSLVVMVVVLTVAWRARQSYGMSLDEEFARVSRDGIKAFREGDFSQSTALLTRAEEIHRRRKPDAHLSPSWQQALREGAMLRDLLQEPLAEALRGAEADLKLVNHRLAEKSIIFDGTASLREKGVIEFPFVLFIGNAPVRWIARDVDEKTLRQVEVGSRMILVARLGELQQSADGWILECRAGQVVEVTSEGLFKRRGWDDEEARKVVQEQASHLKMEDI